MRLLYKLFANLKNDLQGSPGNLNDKDDFSDLPPNQRRKKLQAKIEEITGKVNRNYPMIQNFECQDNFTLSNFTDLPGNCCSWWPYENETSLRSQHSSWRSHVHTRPAHWQRTEARQTEIWAEKIPGILKLSRKSNATTKSFC